MVTNWEINLINQPEPRMSLVLKSQGNLHGTLMVFVLVLSNISIHFRKSRLHIWIRDWRLANTSELIVTRINDAPALGPGLSLLTSIIEIFSPEFDTEIHLSSRYKNVQKLQS